ncbi:hypothetical protein ACROYT_G008192 [Oculina patagonica]
MDQFTNKRTEPLWGALSPVIANIFMEDFEERAIASAIYKPKIWKRYVDDTFTILDRDQVDGLFQHLNNQQPTIRFTMETEKDNSIPFLDTSVIRDSNGLLTTSVYRKPTHTDQYLAYDSHHPQSVKRGIVKCLYDRAKHLITKPSVISQDKKHLSSKNDKIRRIMAHVALERNDTERPENEGEEDGNSGDESVDECDSESDDDEFVAIVDESDSETEVPVSSIRVGGTRSFLQK